MIRNLSIATVPACNRIESTTSANGLADASQVMTNTSLIVVCVVFVLFALAGYVIAELSMLEH